MGIGDANMGPRGLRIKKIHYDMCSAILGDSLAKWLNANRAMLKRLQSLYSSEGNCTANIWLNSLMTRQTDLSLPIQIVNIYRLRIRTQTDSLEAWRAFALVGVGVQPEFGLHAPALASSSNDSPSLHVNGDPWSMAFFS